jgi:hypothetical protein
MVSGVLLYLALCFFRNANTCQRGLRALERFEASTGTTSLLVGKSDKDPHSTIRFFRTHVGSVGNPLAKTLESRHPQSGAAIFQGDLSSTFLKFYLMPSLQ